MGKNGPYSTILDCKSEVKLYLWDKIFIKVVLVARKQLVIYLVSFISTGRK